MKPTDYVGPIRMPLRLKDGSVRIFTLFYKEINRKRYVILIKGNPESKGFPLRIESACVFGHIFRGVHCDCQYQFEEAMLLIAKRERGMIIFAVDDDGRGTGMYMHFFMYYLRQQKKMTTQEVYRHLRMDIDIRRYDDVVKILRHFKVRSVQIMTNNVSRLRILQDNGIEVRRLPLQDEVTPYNEKLLVDEKEHLGYLSRYITSNEAFRYLKRKLRKGILIVHQHNEIVFCGMTIHNADYKRIKRYKGVLTAYCTMQISQTVVDRIGDAGISRIVLMGNQNIKGSDHCRLEIISPTE